MKLNDNAAAIERGDKITNRMENCKIPPYYIRDKCFALYFISIRANVKYNIYIYVVCVVRRLFIVLIHLVK